MYHDGHPEEYAPSSPETAQQDFQEGVWNLQFEKFSPHH
jgi:hypothetical protein